MKMRVHLFACAGFPDGAETYVGSTDVELDGPSVDPEGEEGEAIDIATNKLWTSSHAASGCFPIGYTRELSYL